MQSDKRISVTFRPLEEGTGLTISSALRKTVIIIARKESQKARPFSNPAGRLPSSAASSDAGSMVGDGGVGVFSVVAIARSSDTGGGEVGGGWLGVQRVRFTTQEIVEGDPSLSLVGWLELASRPAPYIYYDHRRTSWYFHAYRPESQRLTPATLPGREIERSGKFPFWEIVL